MFYSNGLMMCRRKPILVAAYCEKRLKKSQVNETDIPSSVDEIIDNEVMVTYRMLGYLLLGVVRIYSKKVEYLYHDFSEFLSEVQKYAPFKRDKNPLKESMCAPYYSITLPERFELDAFDLGMSGYNGGESEKPHHKIPLEEIEVEEGNEHYSHNKLQNYRQKDVIRLGTSSTLYIPFEDEFLPHVVNMDAHLSCDLAGFEVIMEKLRFNNVPQEECLDDNVHGEHSPLVIEKPRLSNAPQEDSLEEDVHYDHPPHVVENLQISDDPQEGYTDNIVRSDHSPLDVDTERNSPCKLTSQTIMENRQENDFRQEEHLNNEETFSGDGESLDIYTQSNEVSNKRAKLNFLEVTPPDLCNRVFKNVREDHSLPTMERTPDQSKLPLVSGVVSPEFMLIRTPATKEPPRFSRKRKHSFDVDMVVLSNEFLKQGLVDASNLVFKRRRAPKTVLGAWRASKISKLCQTFMEPLLPCISSQLNDTLSRKNFGTVAPAETSQHLEEYRTPCKSAQQNYVGKSNLNDLHASIMDSVDAATSFMNLGDVTTPATSLDQFTPVTISIQTPATVTNSFWTPETVPNSVETPAPATNSAPTPETVTNSVLALETVTNSVQTPETVANGVHTPDKLIEGKTCASFAREADEPPTVGTNINLIDEETETPNDDNQNLGGWSARTRMVADILHNCFSGQKGRNEDEMLSLKPVLKGKTRKESARIFYEILVLKTRGIVDVKQASPYGDILVSKTSGLEELF